MSLTLLEASKLAQDPLQKGVIEIFPKTSPVLERLPFLPVSSNSYTYNLEEALPGIAFRGFGETYTESTGTVNPHTETLCILGGVSDYDRALIKTQGNLNNLRAIHDAMKAKSAALKFTRTFFRGDSSVNSKEFDGLLKRLTGTQVITKDSPASGGDVLSLELLDMLLDAVIGGADIIFCNKTIKRKINNLVRAAGQAMETVSDAFGRPLSAYAGVPIAVIEDDHEGNPILGFDEANPGGGTDASTSIYAMRFGVKEYLSGLQCGSMDVIDMGLYSGGTAYRTLIEWICGVSVFHPKAAARLKGIKNDLAGVTVTTTTSTP